MRQQFGKLSDPPGGTSDVAPQQGIGLPGAKTLSEEGMGFQGQQVPGKHVHKLIPLSTGGSHPACTQKTPWTSLLKPLKGQRHVRGTSRLKPVYTPFSEDEKRKSHLHHELFLDGTGISLNINNLDCDNGRISGRFAREASIYGAAIRSLRTIGSPLAALFRSARPRARTDRHTVFSASARPDRPAARPRWPAAWRAPS